MVFVTGIIWNLENSANESLCHSCSFLWQCFTLSKWFQQLMVFQKYIPWCFLLNGLKEKTQYHIQWLHGKRHGVKNRLFQGEGSSNFMNWYINLVSFYPITSEYTRLVFVHKASISLVLEFVSLLFASWQHNTIMPCKLLARLCHAFLVSIVNVLYHYIFKKTTACNRLQDSRENAQREACDHNHFPM